jgi:hypothetical protein
MTDAALKTSRPTTVKLLTEGLVRWPKCMRRVRGLRLGIGCLTSSSLKRAFALSSSRKIVGKTDARRSCFRVAGKHSIYREIEHFQTTRRTKNPTLGAFIDFIHRIDSNCSSLAQRIGDQRQNKGQKRLPRAAVWHFVDCHRKRKGCVQTEATANYANYFPRRRCLVSMRHRSIARRAHVGVGSARKYPPPSCARQRAIALRRKPTPHVESSRGCARAASCVFRRRPESPSTPK